MKESFQAGKFVISLDFELMWGVRDKRSISNYGPNLLGVHQVIPNLLDLFDAYDIKATFSTVGFLFAPNKDVLLSFLPLRKPRYRNNKLSPYPEIANIAFDEASDPYHFGYPLIKLILENGRHEIGTHTFSHYYCLEPGQDIDDFRADLTAAQQIAQSLGLAMRSIIFPRNQFNKNYLQVCADCKIESYRGNPKSWIYEARNASDESLIRRSLRLIDAYINISGHHCHSPADIEGELLVNVAASRFLRPWSRKLRRLEPLRLRRIKRAMLHAAKNKLLFHLWWHPHNFGVNLAENLHFLKDILIYYKELNQKYNFSSATMSQLSDEFKFPS